MQTSVLALSLLSIASAHSLNSTHHSAVANSTASAPASSAAPAKTSAFPAANTTSNAEPHPTNGAAFANVGAISVVLAGAAALLL